MIMVHCGCSYTSSPIHTVEDRPDSGHAYNKTQPFNVRGKKPHKKQPQQQKQEKNPVNTNF